MNSPEFWGKLAYRRFGFICTGFNDFVAEIQADALKSVSGETREAAEIIVGFVQAVSRAKNLLRESQIHSNPALSAECIDKAIAELDK